ncbi:tryptophanyl-tRNA synthetase [Dialister hominis]|uniref:tryptophanyl-tRNA synthetase n=1 Tax=Dialister hominis TaxID=2582419 RepID=UPI00351FF4B2
MGELYKTQHTIDEMLDRMGVKIVLDSEHLSEEDKFEAEKNCASVVLKKVSDKEDKKDGKDE